MRVMLRSLAVIALPVLLLGCGGGGPKMTLEEAGLGTAEAEYAKGIKQSVLELQSSFKSEGAASVGPNVTGIIETMEDLDDAPVGEHKATYDQIVAALKELQSSFAGGTPAQSAVKSKVDALVALANSLPGEVKTSVGSADPSDPDG